MAGNTQMNENERGIFGIHGITGMILATALLLSILGVLTLMGINVQQDEATNYYKINQDIQGLKAVDSGANQYKNYELVGK